MDWPEMPADEAGAGGPHRGLAGEDRGAKLLVRGLEARRDVHGIADRRVVDAVDRADISDDAAAGVEADADLEGALPAALDGEPLLNLERGAHGGGRVVG